jgi:hypothetical protein
VVADEADVASLGFNAETVKPLPEQLRLLICSLRERWELLALSQQTGLDFLKVGLSAK